MGKNRARKEPPKNVHALNRMNYLYQASKLLTAASQSKFEDPEKRLSPQRLYAHTMGIIAQKLVMKMYRLNLHSSPSIKRTICKRCNTILIPGKSSTERLVDKPVLTRIVQCLSCMREKRFVVAGGVEK